MYKSNLIQYPFLLKCCSHTDDIFWHNIFIDLAHGICPHSTYIYKNILCCSYKHIDISYKLIEKDSKVLYQELYDIFINKLNIRSQKDIISHCPSENENIITKWSDIKKRQLKQFYINNYIIDMKNKYNLSATNVDLLVYYIVIGMLFKQLVQCDSDIIFKDERIIKIDGISFENNKVIITKNIYNYSNNKIKNKNETKQNMYKNWVKYNK
mgnify:FL=1